MIHRRQTVLIIINNINNNKAGGDIRQHEQRLRTVISRVIKVRLLSFPANQEQENHKYYNKATQMLGF